ncbi:MAG TPA: hypothetical protein VE088_07110 [Gaiellaceae bacterium]|nr:hypothetical protein [Gaiellaceae bacterium]
MASRLFKIRMRPGAALVGLTNDGTDAPQAVGDEEVLVSEQVAAFLVRGRAAEVVEVIEQPEDDAETK